MEIRNATVESFLKSFGFSVLLFVVWGYFSFSRGRRLVEEFGYVELLWFVYNVGLLVVVAVLYDRRAKYKEGIMGHSEAYMRYVGRVKYRFVPGVY